MRKHKCLSWRQFLASESHAKTVEPHKRIASTKGNSRPEHPIACLFKQWAFYFELQIANRCGHVAHVYHNAAWILYIIGSRWPQHPKRPHVKPVKYLIADWFGWYLDINFPPTHTSSFLWNFSYTIISKEQNSIVHKSIWWGAIKNQSTSFQVLHFPAKLTLNLIWTCELIFSHL
jgi:hypothetical protein